MAFCLLLLTRVIPLLNGCPIVVALTTCRQEDGLSIRNLCVSAQPLSKFKSASILIVYRSATLDMPRCVLVMMRRKDENT